MAAGHDLGQAAVTRPNIVVIIADQVRRDFVGAYGLNPMNVTPNMGVGDQWNGKPG